MLERQLTDIALRGFIGIHCYICKRVFEDLKSLKEDMVWCGYGRVACKKCFEKENDNAR